MEAISILIYDLVLFLYVTGIRIAALFNNEKAKLWVDGRKNIFEKIKGELKPDEFRVWVHCASLGEFEQGRPLIEKIKKEHPEIKIVLTFYSPSGYEIRKNYAHADYVFYLPADTHKNARKFLDLVKPRFIIFVKYEFWFHYFTGIYRRKIPFIMVSAVMRTSQSFFKWYGNVFRKMLNAVTFFFTQDNYSQKLLHQLDLGNSTVCGDTRIDRVIDIAKNVSSIPAIEAFINGQKAIIGGSVYIKECTDIQEAINAGIIKEKLVIVPHDISASNIKSIREIFGNKAALYSELTEADHSKQILIVNTVGLLSSIYQYGQIAIIGGGFGKGIHNLLEPATFGLPMIFGPNYHKFKEAHEFISCSAGFSYRSYEGLAKTLTHLSSEKELLLSANAARTYIEMYAGGTEKIYSWIEEKGYLKG